MDVRDSESLIVPQKLANRPNREPVEGRGGLVMDL
jgi:hypothetical protein